MVSAEVRPGATPWRSSLAAGALALAAYLILAPSVTGDKDAAEFTLVLGAGGVAHPTGYPLYTLLGHPFVKLLHGLGATWPYAANAWCALGGALAVLLLHRLARRLVEGTGTTPQLAALLAWAPVLLFALNPIWTYETTLAETGSWHVAWAAGAALLALRLLEGLSAEPDAAAPWRRALAWGLVCGAGLAHHLTALLLIVPLTVALGRAAGRRALTMGVVGALVAGVVLPLLSYGWIAWRAFHPGPAQWPVLAPTWRAIWEHVTAAQYRGYLGGFDPSPGQTGHLTRYVYPFLVLVAAALVQAIRGARRGPRRTLLWAVAWGCAVQVVVILVYGVPDPGSYFLPVLGLGLVAAAPAAAGRSRAAAAGGAVRTDARATASRGARWRLTRAAPTLWLVALALALLNGSWAWTNWERRGQYLKHDDLLRRMWASVTIDRGFLLWHSDTVHRLQMWQTLDGEKPGLFVANPAQLTHPWPRQRFAERFGFDPVAGVAVPAVAATEGGAAALAVDQGIAERINEGSDLPVVVFRFDESGPSVIMLNKAGAE